MERARITNRTETETLLASLGISFKVEEHKEIFTVKEGLELLSQVQGEFIKNLFLKDKKGRFHLLSALHSTEFTFKQLPKLIPGSGGGIRQAPEEALPDLLGVTRGAVTPLALANDHEHTVNFHVDQRMLEVERILVHPMENTSTMEVQTADFLKFLEHIGRKESMNVIDFAQQPTPAQAQPKSQAKAKGKPKEEGKEEIKVPRIGKILIGLLGSARVPDNPETAD